MNQILMTAAFLIFARHALAQSPADQMSEAAPVAESPEAEAKVAAPSQKTITKKTVTKQTVTETRTKHAVEADAKPTDAAVNESDHAAAEDTAADAEADAAAAEKKAYHSVAAAQSTDINPLSFFIGYGSRRDRLDGGNWALTGGAEYRLIPKLSLQLQGSYGFRGREDFGNGASGWRAKDDLWMMLDLGLKWNPIMFMFFNLPADVFVTGGLVTATTTGGAFEQGTQAFAGLGASYYFEPNIKGVLDVRGAIGQTGYGQGTVGINFQFP